MNPEYLKTFRHLLIFLLFVTGHQTTFAQLNYTANDQVNPYPGPFHYGTNMGYYPGWTDGDLGDLAAGNPTLNLPGVGATTLRPGLFEHYLEQYGYNVNLPWFQHYDSLGLTDHTLFIGYPSEDHRDPEFHCSGFQSEAFKNMYAPIWDDGANGTPVNDTNYYALFLYNMVTIYQPYIKFWEIWNEPDLDFSPNGMGWRPPGDPEGSWWDSDPDPCDIQWRAPITHYNRLMRISYEVIKTLDPDAYVTVGGLGFPSFLDAMMRNTDNPVDGSVTPEYPLKGGAYFDVLSFHSYPHINGSLVIWDPVNGVTGYQRHSDAASKGIIEDLNEFKNVMHNYGYDGNTYPEKLSIMTESNIPRKKFGEYIGSEMAQVNYLIKLPIDLQKAGVEHFHVYDLGEKDDFASAQYPFQVTGLYENLIGENFSTATRTNGGIAYKTVSDILFGKEYDEAQTNAMNLPANVDGGAFKDSNLPIGQAGNEFTYVLWAKTVVDDSEVSFASYSFPASFNLGNLEKKSWDFSVTNQQEIISQNGIMLTGSPIFLSKTNQGISFSCPSDITETININQTGKVVTWSAPTTSTICPGGNVYVQQIEGMASGSYFTLGTHSIAYEITDDCGNIETCNFMVTIEQNSSGTGNIDCPAGQFEVKITVIGNGSVDLEFPSSGATTQTCNTTCTYCISEGELIKFIGIPNAGETFVGWSGSGCSGNDVCWKSIGWHTDITATFSNNNTLTVSADISDVSCHGGSDGNVLLNVSGGSPGYTYEWSNGQTSASLNHIIASNYFVTVTDTNGATATTGATVSEPTSLNSQISAQTNVSCVAGLDGSITASVLGGSPPYQFSWSNGGTSATITNLFSGTYTVTISDDNNCTTTTSTTVLDGEEPPVAHFSKNIQGLTVSFSDLSNNSPNSWNWDFGDGGFSAIATSNHTYSSAGYYTVCLTVENNCDQDIFCQNISVGLSNDVIISLENVSGNSGEIVKVPVMVTNFNDILSFQHSISIPDTSKAIFVGVTNFNTNQLVANATIGVTAESISTIWLSNNGTPISVDDGTVIYWLEILIKALPNECVDIVMDGINMPIEFIKLENGNVVQVPFSTTDGEVCALPGVFVDGIIQREDGIGIENVELFNNGNLNSVSFVDGSYQLPPAGVGSNFVIEPHKNINVLNGVTSFDLALIQQHLVGNALLDSPYKMIAADINHNNQISSFDLLLAQQVIVGVMDSFPNNESWRFVPADFVFQNSNNPFTNPFPESISLNNVTDHVFDKNFIAIKVGDVNASSATNDFQDGNNSGDTRSNDGALEFLLHEKHTSANGSVVVEFLAKDFNEISAFQFDLFFEKNQLEFDRMESAHLNPISGNKLLENGTLTLVWYDNQGNQSGQTLEDETVLFQLFFNEKNRTESVENLLSVTSGVTEPTAYSANGDPMNIVFNPAKNIDNQLVDDSKWFVLQNQPNPFKDQTEVIFFLPKEDRIHLTIYDLHGKQIKNMEGFFPQGKNKIIIQSTNLKTQGVYYYRLQSSEKEAVRKMIFAR